MSSMVNQNTKDTVYDGCAPNSAFHTQENSQEFDWYFISALTQYPKVTEVSRNFLQWMNLSKERCDLVTLQKDWRHDNQSNILQTKSEERNFPSHYENKLSSPVFSKLLFCWRHCPHLLRTIELDTAWSWRIFISYKFREHPHWLLFHVADYPTISAYHASMPASLDFDPFWFNNISTIFHFSHQTKF